MEINGWDDLETSVTCVKIADADNFISETTGIDKEKMKHPLTWTEIPDQGIYVDAHGDTNQRGIKVKSGSRDGEQLTIDYNFTGFDDGVEDADFQIIMKKKGDGYEFISNLWNPPEGREAAMEKLYNEKIDSYARAVSEGWDMSKLNENNLSDLCAIFPNTRGDDYKPMEMMGY